MEGKISGIIKVMSSIITIISLILILAAGSSMVVRNKITDVLLRAWWIIPLLFLAVNGTLYKMYTGSITLLHKGVFKITKGKSSVPSFVEYLCVVITAIMESGVILLLRYLIANLLAADVPYTNLAAGGCAAACGFILLAFILLLLGAFMYGRSWEMICANTEGAPVYLVLIGIMIEIINIIVWCVWFL